MSLTEKRSPGSRRAGIATFLAAFAVLLAGVGPGLAQDARLRTERIGVVTAKGTFRFRVEVADTDAARERGLMFRKYLAPGSGMLFDFGTPQNVAFWMKNTLIPLDMLFVTADGRILSIKRNATPFSETPIPSGGDILDVIEIAGGRAAEIGAEPGDRVVGAVRLR